ncbi:MAG: hemolysin family protein, partial [bacterium]
MEFWLLILFLVLSGFFSATETVFLSVNKMRVEGFLRSKRLGAKRARRFLEKPSDFVLTTLIGTNIANIAFSSLLAVYLLKLGIGSGWILALSTVILLIFGEIIPKSLGRDLADPASTWVAPILRFFQILLYPALRVFQFVTRVLLKFLGISRTEVKLFFTRRDLEILIREGIKTGDLQIGRWTLISKVFRLPKYHAYEVMTPRTEIKALEKSDSVEDLRQIVAATGFSKIPVYEGEIDHIVGVAYALDLFTNPQSLAEITRPVSFFPETKSAWMIFRDLRQEHQSIAVLLDEYGGTAGLVTLEDIVEELTGDIEDEHDQRARLRMRPIGAGKWVAAGRTEIGEVNQFLEDPLPDGDYETLAGYLITAL